MLEKLGFVKAMEEWLKQLSAGLEPGRFRFSLRGNLVPSSGKRALFPTIFATRIAWQTRIWDEWPERRRQVCIDFMKSFQEETGAFSDPWLLTNLRYQNLKEVALAIFCHTNWPMKYSVRRSERLRAESRQTAPTLIMIGSMPKYPLPVELSNTQAVDAFFDALDWSNPWNAGSHCSHQMALLSINKNFFGIEDHYEDVINQILQRLEEIRDVATGTWFSGSPSDNLKINGAMKILGGLQWLSRPYPDCTRLLEFSLEQPFEKHGCGFLNRLLVVYYCLKASKEPQHKREVSVVATKALDEIEKYHKPDGGFSFFRERAAASYAYAKVSRSLAEGDLHGSMLIVWALSVIQEIQKMLNEKPITDFRMFLN